MSAACLGRVREAPAFGTLKQKEARTGLGVEVLSVCRVDLPLLQEGKVEEVGGPVDLVVEFLGVCQLQLVFHVGVMANTLEREQQMLTRVCLPHQPPLDRLTPRASPFPAHTSPAVCHTTTYP